MTYTCDIHISGYARIIILGAVYTNGRVPTGRQCHISFCFTRTRKTRLEIKGKRPGDRRGQKPDDFGQNLLFFYILYKSQWPIIS